MAVNNDCKVKPSVILVDGKADNEFFLAKSLRKTYNGGGGTFFMIILVNYIKVQKILFVILDIFYLHLECFFGAKDLQKWLHGSNFME